MRIGEVFRKWRIMSERNLRDVAKETKISASTLSRIEHGKAVDGDTMIKLFHWLFVSKT